ncbi:MAG: tRNA uridine(34) 5-carboxymethylaminomethyl modification radical SAM/GNAT enzyme Elp3 [Chloroflexota bacterium]
MRKATRTISGVTPVAVMTPPSPCPGRCVYCPTFLDTPQSYTPQSPAVLRGRRNGYQIKTQVAERLRSLVAMGHPVDKVELIIMGGTFLSLPTDNQEAFIQAGYEALNGRDAPTLELAQRENESAASRCVGLCLETRPDFCGPEEVERLLRYGATRVELGVQTLDDDIYRLIRRGHQVEDVVRATKLLKDYGFKVFYHWMPGLPGSNSEKDLELTRRLFDSPDFRPDGLKLYPTLVVKDTELEMWYQKGLYQPYPQDQLIELLLQIKRLVPSYVRIARVMRDIPSTFIVAGCKDGTLRQALAQEMAARGEACACIRCREFGHRRRQGWRPGRLQLKRLDYEASQGQEIFLSFEDEAGTLSALLRLRVPFALDPKLAVVRELHVFGPEVPLSGREEGFPQHHGLGRALLQEAEKIAREIGKTGLAVLSGVGARAYYQELGYHPWGAYMVKEVTSPPGPSPFKERG